MIVGHRMARLVALMIAAQIQMLAGCEGCGGALVCATASDCSEGQICLDGVCVDSSGDGDGDVDSDADGDGDGDLDSDIDEPCPPARSCRGGSTCCDVSEECVDGIQCLPVCTNTRCGDNHEICCGEGEICLDDVICAANCAADSALCGESLEICCPAGDVCLNGGCTTPGELCLDDFDCRSTDLYCEHTVGQCLPTPAEPLCEIRPDFDQIDLEVEWHWTGVDLDGTTYSNVAVSPVVGDVSGDDIPDVVITAYAGSSLSAVALVALTGESGELLFSIPPGADGPKLEGIALANLDPSDEALEVVYRLASGGLRIVDGDGTTEVARRDIAAHADARGSVELADLNGDATPDVVVGCMALDGSDISDSSLDFFDHGECAGAFDVSAPCVADLDLDGRPDVTSGAIAIDVDGVVLWDRGGSHGLCAVADLDVDGAPEVISVRDGTVEVVDGAGGDMLIGPGGLWADGVFSIPGGGNGGAPTVADFDGDGLPEISAAGQGAYAVYDPDCLAIPPRTGGEPCDLTALLRWEAPTQDISSSVTGSSVFDFQGDGIAEVVYNDECFLHVYDGRTGEDVLTEPRPNSSRTSFEYPIVVDVDADGNSEFVVVANNDQAVGRDHCPEAYAEVYGVDISDLPDDIATGTNGVFSFGDPGDRWVLTRPIWNQFSYHVTNVSAAGVVPGMEENNWTVDGLNNYRQNVQGRGIFNAPDLEVSLVATEACSENAVRLSAVIVNAGSRGIAAGVPLEFHRLLPLPEELLSTASTTAPLLPGGNERLTVTVSGIPSDTDLEFEVRVDPALEGEPGLVAECDEDNNNARATARCEPIG